MSTLDVTDYGAEGDGSTDDSGAIQSAIDDASTGDTVYFPEPSSFYNVYPGDSRGAEALTIDGSDHADDITLEGENSNTVIKVDGSVSVNHSILRVTSPNDHTVTVRSLVFDGNKDNVAEAWPSFCILARDNGAAGTGDHTFEDVVVRNSIGIGSDIQFGGVRMNRCTARGNRRHGFGFNTGYSGLHDPVPVLKNSLAKDNVTGGRGYYNVDMSTGYLEMRDCVLVGGVNGFKVSDDAEKLVAERVRARDGSNAAFRSTGENDTATVEFGDVVATGFDSFFRLGGPDDYSIQDGTELVVSNCATDSNVQIYLTDSASLDASDAAVYTNRANSAVGLSSNTSETSTIRDFYHYDNDDGDLGETDNLTIENRAEEDKVDISGVPTENDVGAWSGSNTDSTSTPDEEDDDQPSSTEFDDWTPRWAATTDDWGTVSGTTYEGDQALQFAHDGSERRRFAISWDAAGTPSDVEVLDKFRVPSFTAESGKGYHARSHLRASDGERGENSYWLEVEAPEEAFRLAKYTDGNLTTLARFGSPAEDTFYYRRFRAHGEEIKAKVWRAADPEPAGWDVSVTDGDHGSGWVGLGSYDGETVQTDSIGVGTGGSSAPGPDAVPSVSWVSPEDGATVSGSTPVRIDAADAEDPPDALSVEYRVASGSWRTASFDSDSGTFTDTWDTTTASGGELTLAARVTDSSGNTAATEIGVTVSNEVSVETVRSEDVEATSATLVGDLTSIGGHSEATVSFEWRREGTSDWNTVGERTVSSTGGYSADLSGLNDGERYEFRAVAEASETVTGSTRQFTAGGSDGASPSIDSFDVTDRSTEAWNWYDVDWTVSDEDGDLNTVITSLLHDGEAVVAESTSVTGDSEDFTHELRVKGPVDGIRLSVNDVDNDSISRTKSV
jgi:hypothetical protein